MSVNLESSKLNKKDLEYVKNNSIMANSTSSSNITIDFTISSSDSSTDIGDNFKKTSSADETEEAEKAAKEEEEKKAKEEEEKKAKEEEEKKAKEEEEKKKAAEEKRKTETEKDKAKSSKEDSDKEVNGAESAKNKNKANKSGKKEAKGEQNGFQNTGDGSAILQNQNNLFANGLNNTAANNNTKNTQGADADKVEAPEAQIEKLLSSDIDENQKGQISSLSSQEVAEIGNYQNFGAQYTQNVTSGNTANQNGAQQLQEAMMHNLEKIKAQQDVSDGQQQ
ncbi:MAG: hypothetical protein ACI37T_01855, partial [Candidatus Gastranaerophilaceae bacterium]